MLPQTGSLHSVDPLFGVFPRILNDDASRGAFYAIWSKVCPTQVLNSNGVPLRQATEALRESVMLVYRSMAQVINKPNPNPDSTLNYFFVTLTLNFTLLSTA
jgi:hypothetical protein